VAPFIGDDEFVPHLARVLREREIVLELIYAEPISGHGREREDLAREARAVIVSALGLRAKDASDTGAAALS
jgi:hypothetical protein